MCVFEKLESQEMSFLANDLNGESIIQIVWVISVDQQIAYYSASKDRESERILQNPHGFHASSLYKY